MTLFYFYSPCQNTTLEDIMSVPCIRTTRLKFVEISFKLESASLVTTVASHMVMRRCATLPIRCPPSPEKCFFTALRIWSCYQIMETFRLFPRKMVANQWLKITATAVVFSSTASNRRWAIKWTRMRWFSSLCNRNSTRISNNKCITTNKIWCKTSRLIWPWINRTLLQLSRISRRPVRTRSFKTISRIWTFNNNLSNIKCRLWINSSLKMLSQWSAK